MEEMTNLHIFIIRLVTLHFLNDQKLMYSIPSD